MAKGMHRPDVFETFRGQCFAEILFADTRDAVTGEFLAALVDKESVFIERFWGGTVFSDIELEKMNGLIFQFYESVLISLTQDGEGFLLWIEVVEIQGCDFTSPGS